MIISVDDLKSNIRKQMAFEPIKIKPERLLVFLDFDGVLHPFASYFSKVGRFTKNYIIEELLHRHPHIDIVVSSSWATKYSLNELKEKFNPEVRHRFVGSVTDQSHERRVESIKHYLASRGEVDTLWIAIDDMEDFSDNDPIVWVDPLSGLNTDSEILLDKIFSSPREFIDFKLNSVTDSCL